jgi:F0F1-type ATP synthase assembly protein I
MSSNALAEAARQSLRILRWQASWIAALALAGGAIFGLRTAASIAAGGGIGLLWTAYMAAVLFRHSLNHGVRMGVVSVLGSWVIKVVATLSLLVLAFRSKVLIPPAVLAGLFGAMVAYWGWLAFRGAADGK